MTLILYGHVPQAMLAASDRRLTNLHTGELMSDGTNKAVIYPGMSFHFTGLAQIENLPADQWLGDVLAGEAHPPTAFRRLRDAATQAFSKIQLPRPLKRHAFIGVGWASSGTDLDASEPLIVIVSNFLGDGEWLSEARGEFELRYSLLRRHLPAGANPRWFTQIHAASQRLSTVRLRRLRTNVRAAIKHGVGPPGTARLFAEEIREQAKRVNSPVGASLLITVHPHPILTRGNNWLLQTSLAPTNASDIGKYFINAVKVDTMSYIYIPATITGSGGLPEQPLIVDVDPTKVVFDVSEFL